MTEKNWYVVQSNIKCEEKAEANIEAAGIACYLPSYKKEIVHHRTKKVIEKVYPLFRRYLFVQMPVNNADWYKLRSCEGVESVLGINGRPIPVPASSVAHFLTAQAEMQYDDTTEAKIYRGEIKRSHKEQMKATFKPGRQIIATRGTFAGFSGHVVSIKGASEVRAMIQLLGGLVPVTFPIGDIEPEDIAKNREAA